MTKRIILLAGPTASGKTAIALDFARDQGGEVVNADSMQIYRELDVLTARPTAAELAACPHHLYGVLRGDDPCSAERWRDLALPVIEDIWRRGKCPIVVGGTGLYFKALTDGLSAVPEIDTAIREEVRDSVTVETAPQAHERLKALDPELAARLAPGDSQRVARALEVVLSTGRSLSHWQQIPPVGGLDQRPEVTIERHVTVMERARLYERCDRRLRMMVEEGGALEEVAALLARDYPRDLPVMKSLGVPQLARYLAGDCDLETAIILSQTATRQFAKRQMTWFRNQCGDWPQIIL